jgi:hypothetical protein
MNVGIKQTEKEKTRAPTDWERAAALRIANLRMRLLDLTNSNRLLNFKFRDRSRSYVRVIESVPDTMFAKLADGDRFQFRSLPEKTDEPPDEKTDRFLKALEQARLTDTTYRDELNALDDDPEGEQARRIERRLKNRVRAQIGLPPLSEIKELSLAEYARMHGIDPRFDLPSKGKGGVKDRNSLQLLLLPEQMERSLSGIADQTRTAVQEKGVNTLCVAFGYLEWYESDASEKVMYAPLLIQQVDIDRKLALSKYDYSIGALGEDIDVNITLSERLARDFGLRLPQFDEEDTPESYFSKFEKIIQDHPRWRVRRFVVVGHFAFARLVMYNDIDPKLWPGNVGIVGNPNILKLFAGGEGAEKESSFLATDYEVDDPKIASKVPLLITEADSSQLSAIIDVMDQKNIALKGPPGTGKSQTITNIIAAALAKGLRVLFVAEKIAALDVVKDRLTKAGLGEFCFELHSTKSRKKDLLASLEARLNIQGKLQPPRQLDASIAELEKLRTQLSDYVSLVNSEFGLSRKTIHHILWAEQRTRDSSNQLPKKIDEVRLSDADALADGDLEERRMKLIALGEFHQATVTSFGSIGRHPWHGLDAVDLNLFDQEDAISLANDFVFALDEFSGASAQLSLETGTDPLPNIGSAKKVFAGFRRLPRFTTKSDKSPLGVLSDPVARKSVKALLDCLVRKSAKAGLSQDREDTQADGRIA